MIWEERLADNLEELRAELGIVAVTEGPTSWCQTRNSSQGQSRLSRVSMPVWG